MARMHGAINKLLIAEYDDDVRTFITYFFEKADDFEVLEAKTVDEVIRQIKMVKPDWMFLSVEFGSPYPTGLGVLQFMRLVSPRTRVVMMTTDHTPDTAEHVLRFGAQECIVKPNLCEPLERLRERIREGTM